jgi:hypothetical protein
VGVHGRAEVPLAASRPSGAGGRPWSGRGLVHGIYSLETGITATAAGEWASSGLSGSPRAAVWIAVTAVLAVTAAWLAEPAVNALGRCLRGKPG